MGQQRGDGIGTRCRMQQCELRMDSCEHLRQAFPDQGVVINDEYFQNKARVKSENAVQSPTGYYAGLPVGRGQGEKKVQEPRLLHCFCGGDCPRTVNLSSVDFHH